jgi:hypothetical protein
VLLPKAVAHALALETEHVLSDVGRHGVHAGAGKALSDGRESVYLAEYLDWKKMLQRGSIGGGFRHREQKVARKLLSLLVVATAAVSELSMFRRATLTRAAAGELSPAKDSHDDPLHCGFSSRGVMRKHA